MFRDIFTNRLFIGALVLFVFCVGGSLFYYSHQMQKGTAELVGMEDRVKQSKAQQNEQPTVAAPVVEKPEADGTFHPGPHDAPVGQGQTSKAETEPIEGKIHRRPFSEMPSEERLKAVEDWYHQSGLELPPEGYKYVWLDVGIPRRDGNGNPILIKEGEPFFEVTTVVGFAPTREEFAQYQQMEKDRIAAALRGDDAEVERLYDARLRFWLEHQGEIPSVSVLDRPPGVDYTEQINERLYAEYRKAGFAYLIPDEYR